MRRTLLLLGATLIAGCETRWPELGTKKELRPQTSAAQEFGRRRRPMLIKVGAGRVQFSADNQRALVSYGFTGNYGKPPPNFAWARLWDTTTGKEIRAFTTKEAATFVLLADGQSALCSPGGGQLTVWDLIRGRQVRALEENPVPLVDYVLAVSGDGKRVVTADERGTALVWDLASGKRLRTFLVAQAPASSLALSPDNKLALFGFYRVVVPPEREDEPSSVKLFDISAGKLLRSFKRSEGWGPLTFSPDSQYATLRHYQARFAKEDRHLKYPQWTKELVLWEVSAGRIARRFPELDNDATVAVVFLNGGKRLLTGTGLGRLRLWDVANGRELWSAGLEAKTDAYFDRPDVRAFSADGALVAGAGGPRVHLFDAATGRLLRSLIPPPVPSAGTGE